MDDSGNFLSIPEAESFRDHDTFPGFHDFEIHGMKRHGLGLRPAFQRRFTQHLSGGESRELRVGLIEISILPLPVLEIDPEGEGGEKGLDKGFAPESCFLEFFALADIPEKGCDGFLPFVEDFDARDFGKEGFPVKIKQLFLYAGQVKPCWEIRVEAVLHHFVGVRMYEVQDLPPDEIIRLFCLEKPKGFRVGIENRALAMDHESQREMIQKIY